MESEFIKLRVVFQPGFSISFNAKKESLQMFIDVWNQQGCCFVAGTDDTDTPVFLDMSKSLAFYILEENQEPKIG